MNHWSTCRRRKDWKKSRITTRTHNMTPIRQPGGVLGHAGICAFRAEKSYEAYMGVRACLQSPL